MMKGAALLVVLVGALLGCGDDSSSTPTPSSSTPPPAAAAPPAATDAVARVEDVIDGVAVKVTPQDPAGYRDAKTKLAGRVWRFRVGEKEHHAFQVPVTIHLPYDPALVPAGHHIGIAVWENGRWARVPEARSNALKRTVSASVDHFSDFAATEYEAGLHVVGRWYGSAVRTQVRPGYEPTERIWGQTGYTVTDRYKFVFREESHDLLSFNRTIAESASWNVTIGESWWTGGPTGRMLAHPELSVGRAHAEGELNGPMSPEDKQRLADVEAKIATLRTEVARLQTEHVGASDIDQARIESEYESAKAELDSTEASAIAIRFEPRPVLAAPHFQRTKDPNTNEETWTVSCAFDGHATRYDFVSYGVSSIHQTPVTHTPGTVPRGLSLRTPDITAPPAGPFREEFSESGHDDKEVHEFFGTSQPHTTDREITLKGRVVHRLRVPKNDRDANVILAGREWTDDGVMAPAGVVRIRAWLTEPGATRPPDAPPDHVVTAADDGSFSLPMLLLPGKSLILGASWTSAEARITEREWAAISTDTILGTAVADGAEVPIAEGVARSGVAAVRYAMATKDLDLGPDTRGATLRRKDGALELEFDKANAILLGSFVIRTPHINQNAEDIPIVADVSAATQQRLMAPLIAPDHRREVLVRMATEAPGNVTTIKFPGYVVCAPTCCAMALQALGLPALHTELPQAIYDHRKAHDGDDAAPPWIFPFRFTLEAYVAQITGNVGRYAMFEIRGAYDKWPYSAATTYTKKQWLATVADGDYRPWQVAKLLEEGLEARYATQLEVERSDIDVFTAASAAKVLNRLGAGRTAMVSIDHTSRERVGNRYRAVKGGHFLVLVGGISNAKGEIVRLIFNDPYGDLTKHPQEVGYYDPDWYTGGADTEADSDVDKKGHEGAYAPYYGPDINAYDGRIYSKYWLVMNRKDQPASPTTVRGRLLPAD